jgi:hypothetical protein
MHKDLVPPQSSTGERERESERERIIMKYSRTKDVDWNYPMQTEMDSHISLKERVN